MIHLPPLPGSPGYSGLNPSDYVEYALSEANKLYNAGFNGVIIENYMDYPYGIYTRNREALDIIGRVVEAVKKEYSELLVGVNVLRNSGIEAAVLACRYGGDFIRVNAYLEPVYAPEGFLHPIARLIWDQLVLLDCRIGIYADVNVKHSKPVIDFIEAVYNNCSRGRVDGVIVTGWATGEKTPVTNVYIAKSICKEREVWVGSGVNTDNIGLYIDIADGAIIGTSIKEGGITSNPVDYSKAKELVVRARELEKVLRKHRI